MANNPTSLNTPYLFLTGTVLIAVVSLFTIIQPMMDEVNTIRQSIAADTQVLQDTKGFLDSLDSKTQQLQALAGVEGQLATVIPETQRPQDAVRILHEYATQSGVIIESLANNSPTTEAQANAAQAREDESLVSQNLNILSFKMGIVGAYEQVRLFLTLLGKSPRIVDATGIILAQDAKEPGRVTANIDIQFYSQPVTPEVGE